MKRLLIALAVSLSVLYPVNAAAEDFVRQIKVSGRIISPASREEQDAAVLMRNCVLRMTGREMEILPAGSKTRRGDIIFDGKVTDSGLTDDAFRIVARDGRMHVISGGGNGSSYAIVSFMEKYYGVRYYAADAFIVPKTDNLGFPDNLSYGETPTFRYRQTQSYSLAQDPDFKVWSRLEEPSDVFAGNLWVHTFNRILPSSVYGKDHPEWYSYINGERRPGAASQWCLTNPELFETVCEKIDSIFKANPGHNMMSVSQNDGNNTYCQCPDCMKIIEEEGAVSGLYIRFLNKIAERFPDKEFSTLAYLFTMNPPEHVKPLPNVNIMLCDIDCDREVTLGENASGRIFLKALDGWSEISDNIFVWDYGINFDNMVSPFPNFHIIQENMKIFRDHYVTMHFYQIASTLGTDFSELRSWLASKLMWNVDADTDSLITDFMDGYYGPAGQYLWQYEKMLEGALLSSGERLWIYDSPVTHKDGMLNAGLRKQYNILFDKAENAVKDNPEYLKRVWRTRLPLQYAELEIARAEGCKDPEDIAGKLDLFEKRTAELQIPTLNERNNSPSEYCALYRERYIPGAKTNKAVGAKVSYTVQPSEKYRSLAQYGLTDGIYGGSTFVESWIGWEGTSAEFVLDLGKLTDIRYIGGDFLHQLGAWILLPDRFECYTSVDGKDYTEFGETDVPEDSSPEVKFEKIGCSSEIPVVARYVKIAVDGTIVCPSWHYGVGQPSWFFIDEVEIY